VTTEADTCRKDILPKLYSADWNDEQICEQRTITDGRIVPVRSGFVRKAPRRVDYLLRYERNFPLAVVEAKASYKSAGDGRAPYRVHRVISEWDAAGWRPSKADLDRYARAIPDEEYQTRDFERSVALRARTEAIARHLTEFPKKTDRFAKTIVFCVDQEHPDEIRRALNNLNSDLAVKFPAYVSLLTKATSGAGTWAGSRMLRHKHPRFSPPPNFSPPELTRLPARMSCWPV
jgi:type I site-specific restriction endonuclease